MALFEARLVLASVLQVRAGCSYGASLCCVARAGIHSHSQHFAFRGRDDPRSVTYLPTLTMPIKGGLWVSVEERHAPPR